MKRIFISNVFKTHLLCNFNVPIVTVSCILSYFVFVLVRETVR